MNVEGKKRVNSEKRLKHLQKIGFKSQVQKLRKDYSNSKRYNELKHLQKSKTLKSLPKDSKLTQQTGNFLDPTKIIAVSAPKWAIFDYFSGKYIRGYRAHDTHDLSIFSKLLVFCTINTLVTKHKLDMSRFQTIVTASVIRLYKKSRLREDDIITLEHLLHLMLMEEGQEYELVAALNIGAYLQKKRKKQYYSVYDADDKLFKPHIKEFYDFVNSYCQTMKLQNIKYVEHDPAKRKQRNKCSAFDVASLSLQCCKMPLFNSIMKKQQTDVEIKYINDNGVLDSRKELLINKTVQNPYISYFNVCRNWEQNQFMSSHCSVLYEQETLKPIIVVGLSSYSPNDREKDIQQIIEWYLKHQNQKQKEKEKRKIEIKMEEERKKVEEDPQDIYEMPKKNKFKTQLTVELETILQQKLRANPSKIDYRIRASKVNQRKTSRRTMTQAS